MTWIIWMGQPLQRGRSSMTFFTIVAKAIMIMMVMMMIRTEVDQVARAGVSRGFNRRSAPAMHSRQLPRIVIRIKVMMVMMMMMLAVMIMTSSKERQQMSTAWFQTSQTTKAEQGWTWAWYDEEDEVGDCEDGWHHDDGHFNGVSADHYPNERNRISPLKRRMAKLGQH